MAEEHDHEHNEPVEVEEVDEDQERQLDPEVAARRAAALTFIRRYGDPVLKSKATPVATFDDALRSQVQRMGGLMNDALGVGLAAPQIGISQRLLVYRVGQDAPLIALINPKVEWSSTGDEEIAEEGCLSIPGIGVDVERPVHVRVRAQDEYGEPRLVEASGLEARVIQHEVDHLDGVLILDRTSRDQRKEAIRTLREQERAEREREAA
jgi:peptide deformylase